MDDLCDFCNQDALPAVAQAAMAHAQFETIHPFADGNGRTGRALIHVILRRRYEERVRDVQDDWRRRLGRTRKNSAAELLLQALPGAPIVTVHSAASLIRRSVQAVNEAIPRLVDAGVLKQITVGHRNRAFEASELIDSFTALERQLASPDADALTSRPARRVPYRRAG